MSLPRRYIIDTNIVLRFLLGDPPAQAAAARQLVAEARAGDCILEVHPPVVGEALYTMVGFYRAERKLAAGQLSLFLQQRGIRLHESSTILGALARVQAANVDFADAYLAALAAAQGVPIASFDRDFNKFKDVVRFEPSY